MASAIYEYTGVVEAVLEKQTFASGFYKQDIVLTDTPDTPTKYPNHIAFTFKKDNCNLIANVHKGQTVKVRFAIDGRVWQDPKTGKDRYFTDLTGLRLEVQNGDGSSTEPLPEPADVADPIAAGDPEDIPF